MFSEFKRIYENRHEYARKWKKDHPDGKVLGPQLLGFMLRFHV